MKVKVLFFIAIISIISCSKSNNETAPPVVTSPSSDTSTNCLVGAGAITTLDLTASSFTGLGFSFESAVTITKGATQKITLRGEPNIISEITGSVVNNLLTIGFKKDICYTGSNLSIEVIVPTLERVVLSGSGDVTMKGFPSIDKLLIELSGPGSFNGFDTTCKQCTVVLSGTGSVNITASDTLDVTISGSGNVSYKGKPTVTQNITGVGVVIDTTSSTPTFAIEIGSSTLPYIKINTKEAIQNEPKVEASMDIFIAKSHVFSSTIGIEYRGSTSFRLSDKKSYGIELWDENKMDYSTEVLGFPSEEDWILMGHVYRASDNRIYDSSLMHHYLAYQLFQSMGRYASRSRYVELEIDNKYQGVYVFMEKLKRDKNRIDINKLKATENEGEDLTGGYIIKIDKTAGGDLNLNQPLSYYQNNWDDDARYSERISFRSKYDVNRKLLNFPAFGAPYHPQQYLETYFVYEYPKADDITTQQKAYIQKYIHDFETALLTDDFTTDKRTYTNFIDVDSFIDFFIINEVTFNGDGYRLSTYIHKDKSGLLKMGPTWDFNIGYAYEKRVPKTDWIINFNKYQPNDPWLVPFWWLRLLEDPQFRAKLKTRWSALRSNELSDTNIIGLVDRTSNLLISNGAIERNYKKWTGVQLDYNASINDIKTFFRERLSWMDTTIGSY